MKQIGITLLLSLIIFSCQKEDIQGDNNNKQNETNVSQSCPIVKIESPKDIKTGDIAPEISIPGPNGECFTLSGLKGQVVLIHFWASWSGPCRRNNQDIVKIYNKYKDLGFTVFSISLDGVDKNLLSSDGFKTHLEVSKQRWIQAIADDNLTWPYHGCELLKWYGQTPVNYKIYSITKCFLIDKEGIVQAVNLNPSNNLEEAVKKLL